MHLEMLEGKFEFFFLIFHTRQIIFFSNRLIGLCLLQNELLPIFLQRHVLKYILGRQIRFHDLAFFDPIVYESLRQLVKDSQSKNGAQLLQSLELNFV